MNQQLRQGANDQRFEETDTAVTMKFEVIDRLAQIFIEMSETLSQARTLIQQCQYRLPKEPDFGEMLELNRWGDDGGRNVD